MLKKLILENWKSFRYAELPIDPLTVLIGMNASGKSNVIEALEFLSRIASGLDVQRALAGDRYITPLRGDSIWASFVPDKYFKLSAIVQGEDETIDYIYTIGINTENSTLAHVLDESLVRREKISNAREYFQETKMFWTQNSSFGDRELWCYSETSERRATFQNSSPFISQLYPLSLDYNLDRSVNEGVKLVSATLETIFIIDPIPEKMRNYSSVSASKIERDMSNIAAAIAALPTERKAQVESTLSTYLKNLPQGEIQKVWTEKVGELKSDAMLYCEELWGASGRSTINARLMSDGTLRFLGIITALLILPEGSQLVIEDVDNGLHPSRAELLVKTLREIGEQRKIDSLITTHNPALLDALGPEIIPFVVVAHRDTQSGDSKLTLLEYIENLPKLMASGTLGKLTAKGSIERSLSS